MLPIPDGSWITGEFVQDWHTIVSGHAYVILTLDEGIVFKVIENLIDSDYKLTLFSLNPLYQPYDVHVSQIKEIWQFVHYISTELPNPLTANDELHRNIDNIRRDVELIKKNLNKSK
jgi:hypothetical protein